MVSTGKVHTMSVREHVRGGYREVRDGPTIVLNGGEIAGVWYPGTTGVTFGFDVAGAITVGPDMQPIERPGFTPAPKPSARKRGS